MCQLVEKGLRKKMIVVICYLSVIINWISAEEETVSINKPKTRIQPWVQLNRDHVRCFCNLPPCVTTGYMCKSSVGGCFSDLLDSRSATYRGRHGCVEFLTESQRSRCPISDQEESQSILQNKDHPRSLLVCCTNDLCNHVDNPNTRNLINNTTGEDDSNNKYHQDQKNLLYSNSEVWFRAATIAVPICGAVILFALIALAVKILKSENQNSMNCKLGSTMYVLPPEQKHKWQDHNYKQTKKAYFPQAHPVVFPRKEEDEVHPQFQLPLLVVNEIRDLKNLNSSSSSCNLSKNDANAKLNILQCANSSKSIILELEKGLPTYSNSSNINVDSDEKFCNDEKTFIS